MTIKKTTESKKGKKKIDITNTTEHDTPPEQDTNINNEFGLVNEFI